MKKQLNSNTSVMQCSPSLNMPVNMPHEIAVVSNLYFILVFDVQYAIYHVIYWIMS